MTNEELIELGRKSFNEKYSDRWAYDRIFGEPPHYHLMPVDYGERYKIFFGGWKQSYDEWYNRRKLETKADQFEQEFKALLKKYNAEYWSDWPSFRIDDFNFDITYG